MATGKSIFGDYQIPLFLGVAAFFFAGMLGIVGGVAFFTGGDNPLRNMCGIVLVVLIVGGSVFILIGLKGKRGQQDLERVADLLKAYRRIEITKLAEKMEVSPMEAEYTIAECIGQGLVEGYIDRREGEFFTKDALYQVMDIDSCPKCGAPTDDLYLVGEEIRCEYCDSIVLAISETREKLEGGSSHEPR